MEVTTDDTAQLIRHMRHGDKEAEHRLWERLYPELHRLAQHYRRAERPDHTLSATALIHEAYLKLIAQNDKTWQSRAHFIAVACQVMRRVLVDCARHRCANRRAGAHIQVALKDNIVPLPTPADPILALDEALARLETLDARQSRIVELRFFGGLTEDEIADVLGVAVRTVTRDWSLAKAWLYGQLKA